MRFEEWLACTDGRSLERELLFFGERKLRLFAAACLRRVWPLLEFEVSRLAVEAGEQYADGLISNDELCEAWTNAEMDTGDRLWVGPGSGICGCPRCMSRERAAWKEADSGLPFEVWIVWQEAREAESSPACTAARAAFHARELLAWHAAPDRRQPVLEQEPLAQFNLLQDILSGPSKTDLIDREWLAWNNGTVPKIAQTIYEERAFDRLPILADALEDAGCDLREMLLHCRGPGLHSRGCWVVDLILSKDR